MARKGKRLNKAREGLDATAFYPLEDAVKMIKERAVAKFSKRQQRLTVTLPC